MALGFTSRLKCASRLVRGLPGPERVHMGWRLLLIVIARLRVTARLGIAAGLGIVIGRIASRIIVIRRIAAAAGLTIVAGLCVAAGQAA